MGKPIQRAVLSPVQQGWLSLRDDPLVGVREAAETLGCSVYSIRRWLKTGRIRFVRVAGRLKMRQSQILALIQSERYEGNEKCPESARVVKVNI